MSRRDYRSWESPALGRQMELLVFGHAGMPTIVFPTSMGRFYQWEDFGLVDAVRSKIDAGHLQLWCIDSVDGESFYNKGAPAQQRALRQMDYERYVVNEVVPAIAQENDNGFRCLAGASFGAFHAASMALRRPELAGKVVCLSGAYDAARWLDGAREGDAYYVNPLAFVPGLTEDRYLAPLRQIDFVIATGDEDTNAHESRALAALLQQKGIPAALHMWPGWAHDWPYWREMLDVLL